MKKSLIIMVICFTIGINCEAQYSSKNWNIISSAGPELTQLGWLQTKTSKEIRSSPWSVGCETLDREYTIFGNYKDYVGELGVKGGRLQGGWAKCEKEKGKYDFEWLDEAVYGLSDQGVKPWICLSYGNPIYGGEKRLGSKIFESKEVMDAWCKWVEAIVIRYKDVVTEWEIWNEPNFGNDGYHEYAKLLIRTIDTIKKKQPEAEILGFALAGMSLDFTQEVFEILKQNGKETSIDYLTYHPYAFNPDEVYGQVGKLKSLAESYNPDIKLFQGENAAPSDNHYVYHALKDYPWTEISQAKWYLRRMAGDRSRDIRTSVFSIIDIKYPEVLLSMGLLRSNLKREVVYKKPSFYAVQHMVSFFDYSVLPLGQAVFVTNSSRDLSVARFDRQNSPVVLVWYNDQIPSDVIEWNMINLTISDVRFKDPIYVEMMSGKVYELEGWKNEKKDFSIDQLPVWDSVIMIAERSDVSLEEK